MESRLWSRVQSHMILDEIQTSAGVCLATERRSCLVCVSNNAWSNQSYTGISKRTRNCFRCPLF